MANLVDLLQEIAGGQKESTNMVPKSWQYVMDDSKNVDSVTKNITLSGQTYKFNYYPEKDEEVDGEDDTLFILSTKPPYFSITKDGQEGEVIITADGVDTLLFEADVTLAAELGGLKIDGAEEGEFKRNFAAGSMIELNDGYLTVGGVTEDELDLDADAATLAAIRAAGTPGREESAFLDADALTATGREGSASLDAADRERSASFGSDGSSVYDEAEFVDDFLDADARAAADSRRSALSATGRRGSGSFGAGTFGQRRSISLDATAGGREESAFSAATTLDSRRPSSVGSSEYDEVAFADGAPLGAGTFGQRGFTSLGATAFAADDSRRFAFSATDGFDGDDFSSEEGNVWDHDGDEVDNIIAAIAAATDDPELASATEMFDEFLGPRANILSGIDGVLEVNSQKIAANDQQIAQLRSELDALGADVDEADRSKKLAELEKQNHGLIGFAIERFRYAQTEVEDLDKLAGTLYSLQSGDARYNKVITEQIEKIDSALDRSVLGEIKKHQQSLESLVELDKQVSDDGRNEAFNRTNPVDINEQYEARYKKYCANKGISEGDPDSKAGYRDFIANAARGFISLNSLPDYMPGKDVIGAQLKASRGAFNYAMHDIFRNEESRNAIAKYNDGSSSLSNFLKASRETGAAMGLIDRLENDKILSIQYGAKQVGPILQDAINFAMMRTVGGEDPQTPEQQELNKQIMDEVFSATVAQKKSKEEAAVIIQAGFRGQQGKKAAGVRRAEKALEEAAEAARKRSGIKSALPDDFLTAGTDNNKLLIATAYAFIAIDRIFGKNHSDRQGYDFYLRAAADFLEYKLEPGQRVKFDGAKIPDSRIIEAQLEGVVGRGSDYLKGLGVVTAGNLKEGEDATGDTRSNFEKHKESLKQGVYNGKSLIDIKAAASKSSTAIKAANAEQLLGLFPNNVVPGKARNTSSNNYYSISGVDIDNVDLAKSEAFELNFNSVHFGEGLNSLPKGARLHNCRYNGESMAKEGGDGTIIRADSVIAREDGADEKEKRSQEINRAVKRANEERIIYTRPSSYQIKAGQEVFNKYSSGGLKIDLDPSESTPSLTGGATADPHQAPHQEFYERATKLMTELNKKANVLMTGARGTINVPEALQAAKDKIALKNLVAEYGEHNEIDLDQDFVKNYKMASANKATTPDQKDRIKQSYVEARKIVAAETKAATTTKAPEITAANADEGVGDMGESIDERAVLLGPAAPAPWGNFVPGDSSADGRSDDAFAAPPPGGNDGYWPSRAAELGQRSVDERFALEGSSANWANDYLGEDRSAPEPDQWLVDDSLAPERFRGDLTADFDAERGDGMTAVYGARDATETGRRSVDERFALEGSSANWASTFSPENGAEMTAVYGARDATEPSPSSASGKRVTFAPLPRKLQARASFADSEAMKAAIAEQVVPEQEGSGLPGQPTGRVSPKMAQRAIDGAGVKQGAHVDGDGEAIGAGGVNVDL